MPEHSQGASPILLLEWWKPVQGFEELYQVSNVGRVERLTGGRCTFRGRILTNILSSSTGRLGTTLRKNGQRYRLDIHLLVGRSFIGLGPGGYELDHVDGDCLNNRLSNLEYVTPEENKDRALRLGLIAKGEATYNAQLTELQVIEIRASTLSQHAMARKLGVSRSAVCDVRAYRTWRHLP